jgi:hypothetical protein
MEIMVENRVGDPIFHPILDPNLAPQKPRNKDEKGSHRSHPFNII